MPSNHTHIAMPVHKLWCRCGDDAFGDEREGVCQKCGKQVQGYELSDKGALAFSVEPKGLPAQRRRRFAPAP